MRVCVRLCVFCCDRASVGVYFMRCGFVGRAPSDVPWLLSLRLPPLAQTAPDKESPLLLYGNDISLCSCLTSWLRFSHLHLHSNPLSLSLSLSCTLKHTRPTAHTQKQMLRKLYSSMYWFIYGFVLFSANTPHKQIK